MANKKGEKVDLKQKAYFYIKEKIITGEYEPGQDISEEELQNEMNISRTPVREALMRLETERLISIFPRKGIFVSSITQKMIKNVFQIRKMIEPQVIRIVGKNISKEWLNEIKDKFNATFEDLSKDETADYYVNLDKEFHSYLINACDNQYLVNVMNNIFDQNQRMRYQTYDFDERDIATKSEHIMIIDALLEEDIDKAEALMIEHIQNAQEVSLRYIMI
ncbi:MAG: GntR family transcriptional regulator [Clostridia bacterium]|nr:GntR family transcriptional regulator [Clostridia bacterium]